MREGEVLFESTPNPDAIRVVLGHPTWDGHSVERSSGENTADVPLARALLEIDGVTRVLITSDFITVVRTSSSSSWEEIKPQISVAVSCFLMSDQPMNAADGQDANSTCEEDLVVCQIIEVINRFVRPLLARDGGEATLLRFDSAKGVAYVKMGGACGGCPSGKTTLKRTIEHTIKHYVPEVLCVESAGEENNHLDPKARFRAWIAARWGAGTQPDASKQKLGKMS